jgi:DNA topoisomerase-2
MKKEVTEFINNEYKGYARYVLYNRAIPNIIDGFKPVHRKLFFTSLKHCRQQFIKTAALVGYTMAESNYHHGDSSIESAINLQTKDYPGSNNVSMFSGKGNFGNRLIQEAAAGRYTSVKLNPDFLQYFDDFEIMDKQADLDNPEPLCYLPIIPWVLVNGIEGIAVGFSTYILPRDPKKLTHYIKAKLEGRSSYYKFDPYFEGFKGKIYKSSDSNSWIMEGVFERIKSGLVKITEVPIGFDREKYITYLEKLIEKKRIRGYEEKCKEDFEIEVTIEKGLTEEQIFDLLRLRTTLTENLTVIDNEGKLREFSKPEELVEYFIDYRLKKYGERLLRNQKLAGEELWLIDEKKRFIKLILDREIYLTKVTKEELLKELTSRNFFYSKALIETPIYKFTKDELQKLEVRKIELEKYVIELKNTTPKQEWIKEL